jgi:hypothetical protein
VNAQAIKLMSIRVELVFAQLPFQLTLTEHVSLNVLMDKVETVITHVVPALILTKNWLETLVLTIALLNKLEILLEFVNGTLAHMLTNKETQKLMSVNSNVVKIKRFTTMNVLMFVQATLIEMVLIVSVKLKVKLSQPFSEMDQMALSRYLSALAQITRRSLTTRVLNIVTK